MVSEGEKSVIVDWDDGWVGDALREDIVILMSKNGYSQSDFSFV